MALLGAGYQLLILLAPEEKAAVFLQIPLANEVQTRYNTFIKFQISIL